MGTLVLVLGLLSGYYREISNTFIIIPPNCQLLSCACLGLSIWILVDQPSFLNVLNEVSVDFPVYTSAAIVLLVVSILVILIAFLGCCGAQQESRCMLATVRASFFPAQG